MSPTSVFQRQELFAEDKRRLLVTLAQVVHRARQIIQGMRVQEALESVRLDVRILVVVEIVRDVSLSVRAVVLVEPFSRSVSWEATPSSVSQGAGAGRADVEAHGVHGRVSQGMKR